MGTGELVGGVSMSITYAYELLYPMTKHIATYHVFT